MAILEPLPPAPPRRVFFFSTRSVPPSRPLWPRDLVLFYWFMGFFSRGPPSRTSERADCESPLFSLPPTPTPARTLMRVSARKREGEKEGGRARAGKGRNNKKEQMPAAIKTTESIKNFRPFTAELPLDEAWSDNMREKSTTTTMR